MHPKLNMGLLEIKLEYLEKQFFISKEYKSYFSNNKSYLRTDNFDFESTQIFIITRIIAYYYIINFYNVIIAI